jgi:hypothetical protein
MPRETPHHDEQAALDAIRQTQSSGGAPIQKLYDPNFQKNWEDQDRDEKGQFGSGGGGAEDHGSSDQPAGHGEGAAGEHGSGEGTADAPSLDDIRGAPDMDAAIAMSGMAASGSGPVSDKEVERAVALRTQALQENREMAGMKPLSDKNAEKQARQQVESRRDNPDTRTTNGKEALPGHNYNNPNLSVRDMARGDARQLHLNVSSRQVLSQENSARRGGFHSE